MVDASDRAEQSNEETLDDELSLREVLICTNRRPTPVPRLVQQNTHLTAQRVRELARVCKCALRPRPTLLPPHARAARWSAGQKRCCFYSVARATAAGAGALLAVLAVQRAQPHAGALRVAARQARDDDACPEVSRSDHGR